MRRRRSAFTLLEVLLSLALSVVLLAAVYAVIGYQLRQAAAGRELIERATLARALLLRMSTDVANAITVPEASTARRAADIEGAVDLSGGGDMTGSMGMGSGSGMGAADSGMASSAGGGMTGSGMSDASGSSTSGTDMSGAVVDAPVFIPSGVIGTNNELNLFLSRVPSEVFYGSKQNDDEVIPLTCDLRRIVYWVDSDQGLCRMEARLITAEEALTTEIPGEPEKHLLAPEVRSAEFSYFDGSSWTDNWDSTVPGSDGLTPQGPPRAIQIRIGIRQPGQTDDSNLKIYRHVIAIPTGSGTPLTPSGDGTAP